MADFWDRDIAQLDMSDVEKNGLQIYRNYTRSFEVFRARSFAEKINREEYPLGDLDEVLGLLANEEPRVLPIITCAFVDECLDKMYRREVPGGVPGGKDNLFRGYGPLANLASRIQLAYCFDLISKDLLTDINRLKKIGNELSHNWKIESVDTWFESPELRDMEAIEEHVADADVFPRNFAESLGEIEKLRIRLLWIVSRIYYESLLYQSAKSQKLDPSFALYGEEHPAILGHISRSAMSATSYIIEKSSPVEPK